LLDDGRATQVRDGFRKRFPEVGDAHLTIDFAVQVRNAVNRLRAAEREARVKREGIEAAIAELLNAS
jgi:hypothetical protein